MKKRRAIFFCILLIMSLACGCGLSDKSVRVPDTWPVYDSEGMSFRCEAGWTQADISDYDAASELAYSQMGTSNQMNWVDFLSNDSISAGFSRYLAISYLQTSEPVTEEILRDHMAKMEELKAAFIKTRTTTFILDYPQIGKYGQNIAVYFSARFTLEDGSQSVAQVGLVGHGNRLYQFTLIDGASSSDSKMLPSILSSLIWKE